MDLIKCHYCEGYDCLDESFHPQYCTSSTGKCFILVDLTNEHITHRRGCVAMELICFSQSRLTNDINSYMKCCSTNLCNGEEFVMFPAGNSSRSFDWLFLSAIFLLLSIIIFGAISFFIIKKRRKHLASKVANQDLDLYEVSPLSPDNNHNGNGGDQKKNEIESSVSSGSGLHIPTLVSRTFSKDIVLKKNIGGGRFGSVWKGEYRYGEVAVKIFLSRDEASFQREIEIYTNCISKHPNILSFIGSDVTSMNACTQLWLVTAYHELGSLFDYLGHHSISLEDMFGIMESIVSGISFLHNACLGTHKTMEIAHRDIKSKNILMKSRNMCCIADFGLAVTLQHKTGLLDISRNYRVGTKRYMAPEVLDSTLNDRDFDSFRLADIYSLSLVLWEVIRRVQGVTSVPLKYEVPFQHQVPSDPTFDEMRLVVCIKQYRPEIPQEIEQHPILNPVCKIIRETWSKTPASRLTALKLKKTMYELSRKYRIHLSEIQNDKETNC